jgi:hypothetical protein
LHERRKASTRTIRPVDKRISNFTSLNANSTTDLPVLLQITGLQVTNTATPEPATMVLFGTGLLGVGAMLRKRRKVSNTEA